MYLSKWKDFLMWKLHHIVSAGCNSGIHVQRMFHLHIPSKALYLFCMYERPQNAMSIKQLGFIGKLILLTNEQQKYMYMHVTSTEN